MKIRLRPYRAGAVAAALREVKRCMFSRAVVCVEAYPRQGYVTMYEFVSLGGKRRARLKTKIWSYTSAPPPGKAA